MSRKELPSLVNRDTEPSFHLAAFMRPDMYQWLYEHFVNVSLRCERTAFYVWTDNYIDQSYQFMYEDHQLYTFNDVKADINKFIKSMIDDNYYVFTYIDRYHVTVNDYYQKYHFVHPLMVTGYDESGFICIDFDPRHGPLKMNISYDEYEKAFADCEYYADCGESAEILGYIAVCIKLKLQFIIPSTNGRRVYPHYAFYPDRFAAELHDYIYGLPRGGKVEPFQYIKVRYVYGMHTYDEILRYFNMFVEDGYALRFKVLYDFTLHKWMLQKRLHYIADMYEISDNCRQAIIEYNEVYKKAERLRLLNMKCNIRDHLTLNSLSRNPKFVDEFRRVIPELREMEFCILRRIYDELKYGAERKNTILIRYTDFRCESMPDCVNSEQIILKEAQSIHRIDIILPPYISENTRIKIEFDTKYSAVYNVLQEHIKRGYAVINIYPIQHTTKFNVSVDSSTKLKKLKYRLYSRSNEVNWNFNENWFANVFPDSDLQFDHLLNAEIVGHDPGVWTNVDFIAEELRYFHIRYRTDCRSSVAEIYFMDDVCELYNKRFAVAPTNEIYEHIVDMSDHPNWKGRIRVLRFDPVSYDNEDERGSCVIESIKLCSQLPVYRSNEQFTTAQGLNGWGYHTFNEDVTYREMIVDDNGVHAIGHNEVNISSCEQTSAVQLASARIWTCPASGAYKVNCNAVLATNGTQCKFSIKHNHKPIYVTEELIQDQLNEYGETLILEKGEMLRFEFYNHNQNTTETLKIIISIEKQ